MLQLDDGSDGLMDLLWKDLLWKVLRSCFQLFPIKDSFVVMFKVLELTWAQNLLTPHHL